VRLRLFFLWRLLRVRRPGGDDLCIFPFDFLELFGSDEAYASPAFFVSKIQAIFSISRLLGRRLSS
jgi:hypothetical protein